MKAMVFAAGLGTRLRPLTDTRPKALVEIGGRTLLDITLSRLRAFGISEVIINAHHFADMIRDYLEARVNFGMRLAISREDVLLDTGGGLKKAADFFLRGERADEPFIAHNVDVVSTIDLARIARFHQERGALATLAVQRRESARCLLFGPDGRLCGRRAGHDAAPEMVRATSSPQALAFCGIHVISPRIFPLLEEQGVFPIIPAYLRLAAGGENILAFPADEYYWRDVGRPEHLAQAAEELARQLS
jgi:NDP-sugar pyrophosphorylase family protein